jgi:hypothetical protein
MHAAEKAQVLQKRNSSPSSAMVEMGTFLIFL